MCFWGERLGNFVGSSQGRPTLSLHTGGIVEYFVGLHLTYAMNTSD